MPEIYALGTLIGSTWKSYLSTHYSQTWASLVDYIPSNYDASSDN